MGQAYCKRCSLVELQASFDAESRAVKRSSVAQKIRMVCFALALLCFIINCLILNFSSSGNLALFDVFLAFWIIGGFVCGIINGTSIKGLKDAGKPCGGQFCMAMLDLFMLIPITVIADAIRVPRIKKALQKNEALLEKVKAAG